MKPTNEELIKEAKYEDSVSIQYGLMQELAKARLQGRLDVLEEWLIRETYKNKTLSYLGEIIKIKIARIKEVLK